MDGPAVPAGSGKDPGKGWGGVVHSARAGGAGTTRRTGARVPEPLSFWSGGCVLSSFLPFASGSGGRDAGTEVVGGRLFDPKWLGRRPGGWDGLSEEGSRGKVQRRARVGAPAPLAPRPSPRPGPRVSGPPAAPTPRWMSGAPKVTKGRPALARAGGQPPVKWAYFPRPVLNVLLLRLSWTLTALTAPFKMPCRNCSLHAPTLSAPSLTLTRKFPFP